MSISAAFDYLLRLMIMDGLDFWKAYCATKKEYPDVEHIRLIEMYFDVEGE